MKYKKNYTFIFIKNNKKSMRKKIGKKNKRFKR